MQDKLKKLLLDIILWFFFDMSKFKIDVIDLVNELFFWNLKIIKIVAKIPLEISSGKAHKPNSKVFCVVLGKSLVNSMRNFGRMNWLNESDDIVISAKKNMVEINFDLVSSMSALTQLIINNLGFLLFYFYKKKIVVLITIYCDSPCDSQAVSWA